VGLYWYRQGPDFKFTKFQFMGDSLADKPPIGHVNTDGIMDICVATKVGLAVFLGK
jgi:hypothetical protein